MDLLGGEVVRLRQGDPGAKTVYSTDIVGTARRFAEAGARMIHVVDLDAALDSGHNRETITAICEAAGVPVQVGGGLRSRDDVAEVLGSGAQRVVLGTAAVEDPVFLDEVVTEFGPAIVVALDVKERTVMTHGWREDAGPLDLMLAGLAAQGVPRFMLTQIEADGMLTGPDLDLYRHAKGLTFHALIASGGVSDADDLRALAETGVEATIVGKAIYEGTVSLEEVAEI
jgi:phosphoribosylformimino-5-aminoimidazole carboxamide ribotide isomerase